MFCLAYASEEFALGCFNSSGCGSISSELDLLRLKLELSYSSNDCFLIASLTAAFDTLTPFWSSAVIC